MRLEHAHPCPESVVESVTPRFDPEHDPNDREIEKENEMRNAGVGKSDRDDGRAARHRPVRRGIEPGAPDHDATEFAPVKMRHRIDVTLVVKTGAVRDVQRVVGGLLIFGRHALRMIRLLSRARQSINSITHELFPS